MSKDGFDLEYLQSICFSSGKELNGIAQFCPVKRFSSKIRQSVSSLQRKLLRQNRVLHNLIKFHKENL